MIFKIFLKIRAAAVIGRQCQKSRLVFCVLRKSKTGNFSVVTLRVATLKIPGLVFFVSHQKYSTGTFGTAASMLFALIFLHETVSAVNFAGVALIFLSLAVTSVFGKKDSFSSDLKKWLPAVTGSMLLSGTYQILLTGTVLLSEHDRKAGIIIPCLLCSGAFWNLLASLIERRIRGKESGFYHFSRQERKVLFCWAGAALLQYYLLFNALSLMRKAGMASLTWPMLIGINITAFSVFCRLKWKEKYPPATVIGIIGCILGLIMIIWGRK